MFLTCFMHAQVFTSVVKAERKVSRIKQVVGGGGSKFIHNNDSHIVCSGYVC